MRPRFAFASATKHKTPNTKHETEKRQPPPWGKAAARGVCRRTGERTCCLNCPGEGGSLSRGRDPWGKGHCGLRGPAVPTHLGVARALGEGSPERPGTDPRFAWGKLAADG